jgi:putative membrane protein
MQMIETNRETSNTGVVAGIFVLSAAATAFLLWLLYVHHAPPEFAARLQFLPALNAVFNGCSAIALVTGFLLIRKRKIAAHRAAMITAFAFSSLFLASYITNHALHGDILFPGHGVVRTIYLSILITHVLLSVIVLPMILITFYFSLSGRFAQHKRIARVTFPIWLYVSVTGVVVYAMLASWS